MTAFDMTQIVEEVAQADARAAFAYRERCRAEHRVAFGGFGDEVNAEAAWSELFPTMPSWWFTAYQKAANQERAALQRRANSPRERAKRDPGYAMELVLKEWSR